MTIGTLAGDFPQVGKRENVQSPTIGTPHKHFHWFANQVFLLARKVQSLLIFSGSNVKCIFSDFGIIIWKAAEQSIFQL